MDKQKYFFCYDGKLASFLINEKKFKYITHAIHPETRNDFYLFERTQEMYDGIKEYKRLESYYLENCL